MLGLLCEHACNGPARVYSVRVAIRGCKTTHRCVCTKIWDFLIFNGHKQWKEGNKKAKDLKVVHCQGVVEVGDVVRGQLGRPSVAGIDGVSPGAKARVCRPISITVAGNRVGGVVLGVDVDDATQDAPQEQA